MPNFERLFSMLILETILTTGQAAYLAGVSIYKIRKWFDSGELRGYRIPGTLNRRIPRQHFVRFMQSKSLSFDKMVDEARKVILVCGTGAPFAQGICSEGGVQHNLGIGYPVVFAWNKEEACDWINSELWPVPPGCVVIDYTGFGEEASELLGLLKQHPYGKHVVVIGLFASEDELRSVDASSFSATLLKPVELSALGECIQKLVEAQKQDSTPKG